MSDFPAAHSMDTEWFAFDADGNIALFDSGEGGAVPYFHQDFKSIHSRDFLEYCQQLAKDEQGILHVNYDVQDLVQDASLEKLRAELSPWGKKSYDLLLLLSSEKLVSKIAAPGKFVACFGGSPTVVYVDSCRTKLIEQMIDLGEVLGGKNFRLGTPPNFYGLFGYYCGQIPTPYDREEIPEKPLNVKDLPEELQIALCTSHFENIRFTDTEKIQPLEHTKCSTWGNEDYWIDSQGNERQGFNL